MVANPTPGPWIVQPYGDGDSLVLHSDGNTRICFMATPGSSSRAFPTIEANARLISAAPDLLTALREMVEAYREGCDPEDEPTMVRAALAAIAKAVAA